VLIRPPKWSRNLVNRLLFFFHNIFLELKKKIN
jgi:hypothetical protein